MWRVAEALLLAWPVLGTLAAVLDAPLAGSTSSGVPHLAQVGIMLALAYVWSQVRGRGITRRVISLTFLAGAAGMARSPLMLAGWVDSPGLLWALARLWLIPAPLCALLASLAAYRRRLGLVPLVLLASILGALYAAHGPGDPPAVVAATVLIAAATVAALHLRRRSYV